MEDSTAGAYNPVPEPATNTRPDIVSMDVIWSKVLQVYVRCHLRGGAVTLLRDVGRFHGFRCPQSFSVTPGTDRPMQGNPDTGIPVVFLVESGIRGNFVCGIRNHGLWNLESH